MNAPILKKKLVNTAFGFDTFTFVIFTSNAHRIYFGSRENVFHSTVKHKSTQMESFLKFTRIHFKLLDFEKEKNETVVVRHHPKLYL